MARKPRNYRKEYDEYQGTEEQKKRRAQRNAARRKLRLKKGDPKEAGHISSGNRKGVLGKRVRAISFKENRKDQPKRDGSDD
jgi:hypothetical protein